MSIIFAILLFSLLIFVHELGHFMAAKASGVQVNEFAMFMGPAIWKKQKGETLYSIRCIPIGGYCAMEGEDSDTESPRSFQKAAWWKRFFILIAGSAMNLLIGLLIMLIVYMPAKQYAVPEIVTFEAGCTLNGEGGLQVGDRIIEVDGERIYTQSDVTMILTVKGGDVHDLVVERNGVKVTLNNFKMEKHEFSNPDGSVSLRYGFSFGYDEATFGNKLKQVVNETMSVIRSTRLSLQMLFQGKAGLKDMTGPVGIVGAMSDVAESSRTTLDAVMNMLYLGAFIAINLAVMNMLPIPALDGGRVFALLITTAITAITKKEIDPKYEGYIHAAGMVLLLVLMALIMFKDIFTIIKG